MWKPTLPVKWFLKIGIRNSLNDHSCLTFQCFSKGYFGLDYEKNFKGKQKATPQQDTNRS